VGENLIVRKRRRNERTQDCGNPADRGRDSGVGLWRQEKQKVNVPVWAGVGAIIIGGGLLLVASKKG